MTPISGKSLNIVFYSDSTSYGGAEKYFGAIVNSLAENGYKMIVYGVAYLPSCIIRGIVHILKMVKKCLNYRWRKK